MVFFVLSWILFISLSAYVNDDSLDFLICNLYIVRSVHFYMLAPNMHANFRNTMKKCFYFLFVCIYLLQSRM